MAVACSAPPPNESSYLDRLREDRAAKDRAFADDPGCFSGVSEGAPCSPVPPERRGRMLPLRYYEPDPSYRVPAALDVADDQQVFDVPTSTGALRKMQKVGTFEFSLNGEPRTLAAFVELPAQNVERLFVPFRDATTGTETYPAGRYVDLDRTATGIYDLDFNRAYHPYCYYDEHYDCPLPPPENRLKTTVRAGERLPPDAQASRGSPSSAIRPSDRIPTLRMLTAPSPVRTRSALTVDEVQSAIEWGITAEPRPYRLHALSPPGPDGVRATGGYAGAVYTPFLRVAFAARAARRQGRAIDVTDIPAWLTAPVVYVALGFGPASPGREALPKDAAVAVVPRAMAVCCREPQPTLFHPLWLSRDASPLQRFGAPVPVDRLAWVAAYPLGSTDNLRTYPMSYPQRTEFLVVTYVYAIMPI